MLELAADCGPGTQRVPARLEQTITDEAQADTLCRQAAPDYTDFHYTNWERNPKFVDIVFCLKPA